MHRVKRVLAEQLGIDPGPELAALEQAILRQDGSLLAGAPVPTTGSCPYRGLLPFDLDDHETFFGRDDDVRACLDILRDAGQSPWSARPGAGSRHWPGPASPQPFDCKVIGSPSSRRAATPSRALATLPRPSPRTALVVDQAEEVFSLCRTRRRPRRIPRRTRRWPSRAGSSSRCGPTGLRTFRRTPGFARLIERSLYLLGAMTEDGLRAAIEAPARQAGLLIEPGLVDLLVNEVSGTAGALPLLSHALLETWQRREANTLTVEGYTASGGIRGAVAQSAEAVYAGIGPEQRVVLRDLVLRLVSSGTQGEPVRARFPRRLFSEEPDHEELIDMLVGSRLVTSDDGVVEIAHEALARAWPRLRAWLDDDMEGQRILQHLTSAADAWDTLGRPDSELYRGVRLARALQWQERADTRLTVTEIAFIDAAERNEQSERRAEQLRARSQVRLIRRLRTVLGAAVVLLVVALVAGGTAFQQKNRAEDNAAAATAAETRSEARRAGASALITDDLDESMLLAVAGVRMYDSPETRNSLLSALARHPEVIASTDLSGEKVLLFDVSPDGATLATYDYENKVRLYDLATGTRLAEFQAGDPVRLNIPSGRVRFSPDGRILAVTMAPPTRRPVMLLDATSLEPLPVQPGGTGSARWQQAGFSFSKDGRRLAAILWRVRGHDDTTHWASTWAYVWDLEAPKLPVARVFVNDQPVGSITPALTAHGDAMLTTNPLTRHDLVSGESVVLPEPWGDRSVEIVEMSPTGRALAVVSSGHDGVAVLDPRTGRVRRQLRMEEGDAPFYVSFSDDGRRMATIATSHREAVVWDVESGRQLARLPLSDDAQGTDLGADGSTLYTAGSDGALRHWDVGGDRRFVARAAVAAAEGLELGSPSPGGRFVAYPGADRVVFFDVESGTVRATVPRGDAFRRTAGGAWHPDGVHFAVATGDAIDVWDARSGGLVAHGQAPGPEVTAVDYSADGTALVVGELSGRITLLDQDLRPVGHPVQLGQPVSNVAAGPDGGSAVVLTGFDSASTLLGRHP